MAAKKYEYLEHTADVLFVAYGGSFEEALENAAEALFETVADLEKLEEKESFEVKEEAQSLEELVLFTLSDLLGEMEARGLFLKRFEVESFEREKGAFRVKGRAFGSPMSAEAARTVVKAVTHHLLKVERNGGWRIRVLLDI